MSHRLRIASACATALLVFAPLARSAIVYDEALTGDLSGSGLTPTSIAVGLGSNEIHGTTGRSEELGADRDYFAVTVPIGHQIVALIELAGTTVVSGVAFIGIQRGTQVTVPTNAGDATGLLAWAHYPPVSSDTDILATLGMSGFGAEGFDPPLLAGDYAFWIQETGLGSSSYGFDIVIGVPEPGTAAALLVAFAALGLARGRSRHL